MDAEDGLWRAHTARTYESYWLRNTYDLWVAPEGDRFPVGWNERHVLNVEQAAARGLRQEPLEE